MRYWDASALVPLCVQEQSSDDAMRALAVGSLPIVTWALSRLEIVSALQGAVPVSAGTSVSFADAAAREGFLVLQEKVAP